MELKTPEEELICVNLVLFTGGRCALSLHDRSCTPGDYLGNVVMVFSQRSNIPKLSHKGLE